MFRRALNAPEPCCCRGRARAVVFGLGHRRLSIKDAIPKADWQDKDLLEKKLVAAGWQVRRIKVDAQCYEVYGVDTKGQRVEAYFHPKMLEPATQP